MYMKKILSLYIISILISLSSIVWATGLQPSLTTQMAKQETINKKNTITNRLAEQAKKRKEAKDRILTLQYQRLAIKNGAKSIAIITQSSATPILTITRPPVIAPIQHPTQSPVISQGANVPTPTNVDMSRIRSTWLGWYNSVRQWEWLGSYSYDNRLDVTAYDWNVEFTKEKWQNHHTRNPWDGYYNFAVIDQWFIDRGINPKIINRTKHTENVWYGYYSCNSSDCTDTLIRSIRSTFDFFMSEKGKSYDAHYRSIVQPYFTKIWLSVIVVPGEQRYYLVVHYITE